MGVEGSIATVVAILSLSLSLPEFDESRRKPGESLERTLLSVNNSSELAREKHETKCEH